MNASTTVQPRLEATRTLFEAIRAASRTQKQKGLDILWDVLGEMHRERVTDFSVGIVGPRLKSRGGISTEALRNPAAKDYRGIIASYAVAVLGDNPASRQAGRSQVDVALDAIGDPAMRAVFRQMAAENRMLKHQNDQLRSSFKALSVGDPKTVSAEVLDCAPSTALAQDVEVLLPATSRRLLPSEVDALSAALDDGRLAENGWEVQPSGAITNDVGEVVLPPGFATSLAKAIRALKIA